MSANFCIFVNPAILDTKRTTIIDSPVTKTKNTGMTHNSLNFSGESEKATFENRSEGVKMEMLSLLSC